MGAVSINLKYGENITSTDIEKLTIELYRDKKILATNVLQPTKLNDTQKAMDNITSPFNLGRTETHDKWEWVRGIYKLGTDKQVVESDLPDKVVATYVVKGITYVSTITLSEGLTVPEPFVVSETEELVNEASAKEELETSQVNGGVTSNGVEEDAGKEGAKAEETMIEGAVPAVIEPITNITKDNTEAQTESSAEENKTDEAQTESSTEENNTEAAESVAI